MAPSVNARTPPAKTMASRRDFPARCRAASVEPRETRTRTTAIAPSRIEEAVQVLAMRGSRYQPPAARTAPSTSRAGARKYEVGFVIVIRPPP